MDGVVGSYLALCEPQAAELWNLSSPSFVKTFFYVVRHLESTASYLPVRNLDSTAPYLPVRHLETTALYLPLGHLVSTAPYLPARHLETTAPYLPLRHLDFTASYLLARHLDSTASYLPVRHLDSTAYWTLRLSVVDPFCDLVEGATMRLRQIYPNGFRVIYEPDQGTGERTNVCQSVPAPAHQLPVMAQLAACSISAVHM
jgi:hypothetical protein